MISSKSLQSRQAHCHTGYGHPEMEPHLCRLENADAAAAIDTWKTK